MFEIRLFFFGYGFWYQVCVLECVEFCDVMVNGVQCKVKEKELVWWMFCVSICGFSCVNSEWHVVCVCVSYTDCKHKPFLANTAYLLLDLDFDICFFFCLFWWFVFTYILGKMRTLANVSGNLPCPAFSSLRGKLSAAIRDTTNSSRSVW